MLSPVGRGRTTRGIPAPGDNRGNFVGVGGVRRAQNRGSTCFAAPHGPPNYPPPALRASVVTLPQWPPGGPRGPPPADPTPRAEPREDLGRGFGCSRLRGGSAAPGGPGGAASGPRDPGGAASGPPDPDHHVRLHRGSSPRSLGLQPGQHHCLFRPCPLALSQPAHRHPSRSRCTDSPAPGGPHLT
ncbi:basic salivary proline-rich protein 2-like isoform X8 [Canis lupus familiaris]|uniref:basic salivary proline-rich protein 2-like isoform X8 n=1 Tax=Canis lupus familiaris TaxID=9615 RepID=UPI0018F655AE|nr:basic salivary proline-rich protein 2-like isoform X8 [Canis lupus familiaris]